MSNPFFLFSAAAALLLALAFVIVPLLGSRQRATLIGAVIFVPAAALAVYMIVGSPQAIDADTGQAGQIRGAVTELARQAMREPDNAEHWARLGLAYKSLEEFSSAEHAFRRALYIDSDVPFLKAELAETLLYASGKRQLPDEARRLFVESADSGNQKALWFLGLDAFQREAYPAAAGYFERLLALLPEQSNVRNTVERYLATARAGGPGSQTQEPVQRDAGPSLSVLVAITDELAQELEGDETVFVAVRSAAGGPPLAARRLQAGQFPLELAIDDDDAMMAGGGLSSAQTIVVVARVSFSGDAAPQPGDLEGRSDLLPVTKDNMNVKVTIDRIL